MLRQVEHAIAKASWLMWPQKPGETSPFAKLDFVVELTT
jgi:hypothetical protein